MGDELIAILYHADMDGLVAAWVAKNYLEKEGVELCFFPVQYEQPLPAEFTGKAWTSVYILDFSLPIETFETMLAEHAGKLVMLDHHKTAIETYGAHWKIDGIGQTSDPYVWSPDEDTKVIFHNGLAGCAMTEYYFNGGYDDEPSKEISLPKIVEYAADHDLWTFTLPDSKAVRAAFRSYPMNMASCELLAGKMQNADGMHKLVAEGKAILRFKDEIVATSLRHAEWMEIDGRRGLASEMPVAGLISDVGGKLAEQEGADFGCCWFKVSGSSDWVYSLRSRGDFDVSQLAKHHGGGGHKHAAGFNTEDNPFTFLTGKRFNK